MSFREHCYKPEPARTRRFLIVFRGLFSTSAQESGSARLRAVREHWKRTGKSPRKLSARPSRDSSFPTKALRFRWGYLGARLTSCRYPLKVAHPEAFPDRRAIFASRWTDGLERTRSSGCAG